MTRKMIKTDAAPAPVGPYNQAIAATGQLLFIAGQIALDSQTGDLVGAGDISRQTQQVMNNLGAILTAAGASFDNLVKTTIFLTNLEDFATVNRIYGEYFNEETAPARATIEVSRLPKGALVEIEGIAML